MPTWTQDDFREDGVWVRMSAILAALHEGNAPAYHLVWIERLYRQYLFGDWAGRLPPPGELEDGQLLMWEDEAYCRFHRAHPKFGADVIEAAHPYARHLFIFFDYAALPPVFAALDAGPDENGCVAVPHVPVHHAVPEDRHDFRNGAHLWE